MGSTESNNSMGKMYETDIDHQDDKSIAMEYFKKSCDQGNADGMYNAGRLYDNAKNKDSDRYAFKYYKKASELGHTKAENAIACCYFNGIGTEQNCSIAVEYFRRAAEKVGVLY